METRHILQFSTIGGNKRSPGASENGKFPRFNSGTNRFEYACIGDGGVSDINLNFFTTLINEIYEDIGTDKYLSAINRVGDTGRFTRNDGVSFDLELGALAWEDTVEATLTLPGDTKVLFDNSDSIGGSSKFTYNYTLDRIQLEDVPLMFKIGAETFKEGIKYLGNYSWAFGNNSISTVAGSYNITSGHRAGQNLGAASSLNTVYGPYAGEAVGNDTMGNILIGAYAGRFENVSNRFYLDNQSYGDTNEGRDNSFLYADLETERRLYIRDRLAVKKEGKFGTSGLLDAAGEYGMYQMSAAIGGNPQWHDGTVWQNFANSINTYLDDVVYATGNLTFTLSDATIIGPIDISDVNTNVFATSPSSPSTGKTATSDYGYLQISNSAFTNNEGFTHRADLRWDNNLTELNVPGAIKLAQKSQYGASNGVFIQDGTHAYVRLGDTWLQLDNDPLEDLTAVNIGGATYEWFKQKNEDNELEFRTVRSYPIGVNNPNDRITFGFSSDGDAIYIGTTAERNRLSTTIDDPITDVQIEKDNEGETLHIRALREGTGVTLTETDNYILIDATGAGGGEVNTMTNIGAGEGVYYQKNGAQFELKSLTATDARLSWTSTLTEIDLDLDLTVTGYTTPLVSTAISNDTVFHQVSTPDGIAPTIEFKRLISDTITFTTTANNELRLEYGSAATASGTNVGAGAIQVYKIGTAPNFEFRTFANSGNHISLGYNGDLVEVDVDDIILDYIADPDIANPYNSKQLLQLNADNWTIEHKGLGVTATSGLTISEEINTIFKDIVIDQPIPIPSIGNTGLVFTEFTPGNTGGKKGTIKFKVDYDADARDGLAYTSLTFFELNVGAGLLYDEVNNTLYSNQASGVTSTDYALRGITMPTDSSTERIYRLSVEDALGAVENTYDFTIPKYQLPEATYTDSAGATGTIGGVKVEIPDSTWQNGTTNALDLDLLTGKLTANKFIVTYLSQNNLHDANNTGTHSETGLSYNAHRALARANIGAAYVNGKVEEDFTAKDLVVEDTLTAVDTTKVHSVGALRNKDNAIYSSGTSVVIAPNAQAYNESEARVEVTTTGTKVYIYDGTPLEVYNAGTGVKMMKLIDGDLYVSGNIYANADIQAFAGKTL